MTINEARKKAKVIVVKQAKGMEKTDMILAIQKAEGNFSCFGTAKNYCDQRNCAWGKDCLTNNR